MTQNLSKIVSAENSYIRYCLKYVAACDIGIVTNASFSVFTSDINEATKLADGWDWTSRQAEYIATQKNWRQLSFVEYWKTYLPIAYGAWI